MVNESNTAKIMRAKKATALRKWVRSSPWASIAKSKNALARKKAKTAGLSAANISAAGRAAYAKAKANILATLEDINQRQKQLTKEERRAARATRRAAKAERRATREARRTARAERRAAKAAKMALPTKSESNSLLVTYLQSLKRKRSSNNSSETRRKRAKPGGNTTESESN